MIEGWVEGPIAEGADLRGINTLMLDFFDDPAFVRDLFAFVVEMELRFAREQLRAGADVIGVGDAAASLVGPDIYNELVWPYEKKLVDGIHALGGKARLHICGNTRRESSRPVRLRPHPPALNQNPALASNLPLALGNWLFAILASHLVCLVPAQTRASSPSSAAPL